MNVYENSISATDDVGNIHTEFQKEFADICLQLLITCLCRCLEVEWREV